MFSFNTVILCYAYNPLTCQTFPQRTYVNYCIFKRAVSRKL